MSDKLDIFTIKHTDAQISVFKQKKIEKLFEKYFFKAVIPDKVLILKKVSSSIQIFNSSFINDMKNLCIDKTYKKSCLVMYTYKDKKKILY